jgi:hypothetical protein
MAETTDLAALVNRIPELDVAGERTGNKEQDDIRKRDENKLTGPKWAAAQEMFDTILRGGRDSIIALIDMLKEVDKGDDYKVRYVLHGLALYVCRPEKRGQRATFIDALLSQIGGARAKAVQAFLVRELEVAGDRQAVQALGRLLLDEELGDPAARALLAIGDGAAEQFRQALAMAQGRRRLAILKALGELRDAASVAAFRQAAGDQDLDTRLAGIWGLANMGDAGAVDIVIKAAGSEGYERIQATKACLLLAENLLAAGRKAEAASIYRYLRNTRSDRSEQYVREAAIRGLALAG